MGMACYPYEIVSGSDFDGDGKDDPAQFFAGLNLMQWQRSSDGQYASVGAMAATVLN